MPVNNLTDELHRPPDAGGELTLRPSAIFQHILQHLAGVDGNGRRNIIMASFHGEVAFLFSNNSMRS
jgi:hypothetical protein